MILMTNTDDKRDDDYNNGHDDKPRQRKGLTHCWAPPLHFFLPSLHLHHHYHFHDNSDYYDDYHYHQHDDHDDYHYHDDDHDNYYFAIYEDDVGRATNQDPILT